MSLITREQAVTTFKSKSKSTVAFQGFYEGLSSLRRLERAKGIEIIRTSMQ